MTTRTAPSAPAFTLIELMMAVSILALLTAGSWRVIVNDLHRARLNAVSQDFTDWVEGIRKAALRTQLGCEVTVKTLSSASDGAELASVRNLQSGDSPCAATPRFLYRSTSADGRLSSRATTALFIFTPRGTVLGSGNQALPDQVEIRMALKGVAQLRCLRLSGLLGAIQIGANSTTADLGTACTAYGRF